MRKVVKLKLWGLLGIFGLVSIFIALSYFVQNNMEFFEGLVGDNYWGLIVFVLLNIIGIVFAPVTVIPLISIVTGIWGGFVASFAVLVAWFLGSIIAFLLSRNIGIRVVGKFISIDELYKFEDRFSFIGSFWGVLFLRMIIPVDILSYGLGLFSRIDFWRYSLATFLGLIPICFIFGFLGILPIIYQVVLGLVVLNGVLVGMIFRELR